MATAGLEPPQSSAVKVDPKLNSQQFGVVRHSGVMATQASGMAGIQGGERRRLHSRDRPVDMRELRMALKDERRLTNSKPLFVPPDG